MSLRVNNVPYGRRVYLTLGCGREPHFMEGSREWVLLCNYLP